MRARPGSPAIGRWIRRDKRLAIYLRDDFTCLYCGLDLTGCPEKATLDHVVSRKAHRRMSIAARKRRNMPSNLVTCCSRCNSRRGDLPVKKFVLKNSDGDLNLVEFRLRRIYINRHRALLTEHLRRARAIITCFGWGPP